MFLDTNTQETPQTQKKKDDIKCIFGPDMARNFAKQNWSAFQYLPIIAITYAIFLLEKVWEGTRSPFVFTIAALILMTNFADLVFNAMFICSKPKGPKIRNTGEFVYPNWNLWYVFVFWMSSVGNYVFFYCLYKWWDTYRKQEVNMKVEELCSELLGKKNQSKEDFADFDAKTEQQEFKDKHYWEMFFYFFYTMLLYNFYLDFELMRIKYHEL